MIFDWRQLETISRITLMTCIFSWSPAAAQPPTADFSADITSGCFPITVNLTDLSSNSPSSWSWNFGNGNTSTIQNPSAVYLAAGSYTVRLIACNGNGCDTLVRTNYITAFDYPIADLSADIAFGCAPLTVQFTDLSVPVSSPVVWWYWDFGDGNSSTAQNPVYTYSNPGIYDVSISITDSLGCNDSRSIANYVIVSIPPALSYTMDNPFSCTAPLNVTFTNASTLGTYPVVSWLWAFGDGFTDTNPDSQHNYTSNGSYTVSLTATDSIGCALTLTDSNAVILGNDTADFTISTVRTCSGLQASFFGTPNGNITGWSWDFGDGSPPQNGQNSAHTYSNSGQFTITLATTNAAGCLDTTGKNISYQKLTGGFFPDTTYGCSLPFTVNFTDMSVGPPPLSWAWDFSYDPLSGFNTESTLQNPSYSYTYEDTFDVMMVVTDSFGCTNSVTLMAAGDSIWVLKPFAGFVSYPQSGCTPLNINFTDSSVLDMGTVANWAWNFDDPLSGTNNTSSLQNPSHTFDPVGVFNVSLTITNTLGCVDSATGLDSVGYPPPADSIIISLDTACHGEPVGLTAFSSDANVNEGIWYFGDGTSGTGWSSTSHQFQDTGLLVVEFIPVYNGCPGITPVYNSIYILPPKPILSANPTFSCEPPLDVTFTSNSWGADSSWWSFGDGSPPSSSLNTVHTYTSPGRYTAKLTVTNENGCMDSQTRWIDIPQPTAAFSSAPSVGCVPLTVSFTDSSFNYISDWNYRIISWYWDFGDGMFSSLRNPTHTYTGAGVFTVSLTITDASGCSNTMIKTDIITTSASTAEFSGSPAVGCMGLTVNFSDLSTQYAPITSWSWNFGDGSPAEASQNPSHTYTAVGNFAVALTITDAIGCIHTTNKAAYVTISEPSPSFTHSPRVCENQVYDFVNTTAGSGMSFLWDFGDGGTAGVQNPSYGYSDSGSYIVTLTAIDSNGCASSSTSPIRSMSTPVVNFSVDSFFAICPPLIVQFTDLSTSADDSITGWVWDFGDSNSTTSANPVHTFVYPGSFDVQLTVTSKTGCVGAALIPDIVTVAGPTGDFSFSPDTGCVPMTVTFTSSTYNVDIYNWDFGNGVVDTVSGASVTYTYLQPGFPTPQLSITDSMGCKLAANSPVPPFLSIGEVVADFALFPTTLYTPFCPEDTVFFSDSSYSLNDSAIIKGWLWDFGDGITGTDQHPIHVYTAPGTYTISLTAVSSLGCSMTAVKALDVVRNDSLVLKAVLTDSVPSSCFGGSDGLATANGLRGTPPYSFLWDASAGNQTTATATGLMAGTYQVTVTDNNGCTDSTTAVIAEPPVPGIVTDSIQAVSCFGFTDGFIAVSAYGGTPPYGYLWDAAAGSQSTPLANGLPAGMFTVVVTDTNGCVFTDSALVQEPAALDVAADSTDVLCYGGSTGTATAYPSGGTPPYAYLWDAAAGNQTSAVAAALTAGTYGVEVTDSNGCVDSVMAVVNEPSALDLSADSITDVSCNGLSDGMIAVFASGGVPQYSYLWDVSAGSQTTALATGLSAGIYTLLLTDSNGCNFYDTLAVTEPTAIIISVNTSDVLCNGDSNGTATANPTGGMPPYSYLWGPSTGNQTGAVATGLIAGTHDVAITDSTGCTASAVASVAEPAVLLGSVDSIVNVSCNGFSDGSVEVSATGGLSPYTYLWDVGAGSQTSDQAAGLIAGNYTFTITDSNACTYSDSATVTEPPEITVVVNTVDVACSGGNDGIALVITGGGTPPYTFLWNDSLAQTTDTAFALNAGMWTVSISDSNYCTLDTFGVVLEPSPLTAQILGVNTLLCYGDSAGELGSQVSGGIPPYAYSWSPGNSTGTGIDSLGAGTYALTVTDSNNCEAADTAAVVEFAPLALALSDDGIDTVCYNVSHVLDAGPSGGAPPYTCIWSDGVNSITGNPVTILPDTLQTWSVTVTDSAGCVQSDSVRLIINYLALELTFPDTVCYGGIAALEAEASGTLPGFDSAYAYQWSTGQTTSGFSVQLFNSATFTVTVADGCSKDAVGSADINIYAYPDIGIQTSAPACPFVVITFRDSINPGSGNEYFWNFGDNNTASGPVVQHGYVNSGVYYPSVTVTTPNGCSRTVTSQDPVIIYAVPGAWFEADPFITTLDYPLVNFTDMSSVVPVAQDVIVSYLWEFGDGDTAGAMNPSHSFPNMGTYSVSLTVATQYGCEGQVYRDIRIDAPYIDLLIPTAFTPNPDGSSGGLYDPASFDNDVFYPLTNYVDEYLLQVFNRWGELVFESADLAIGWDGYYRGKLSQQATYIWKLRIVWITGKEYNDAGRVLLIR